MGRHAERIKGFRKLESNWDSYGGHAINPKAIEIALMIEDKFSGPEWTAVPKSDGGIQFESEEAEVQIDVYED